MSSRIGEKLRTLRERHGLSTRQLGNILGVSNTHITYIENDVRGPSIDLLEKIARYFEVTTDQLIMDELEV